ncbi:hypothetical protein ACU4GD_46020 [Cupriavidus basilensis]
MAWGKTWDDPDSMKFLPGRQQPTIPYLSDGMWFLTQHKRWGLLKDHPGLPGGGEEGQPHRRLQADGAAAAQRQLPKSDLRTAKLLDGVVWDASKDSEGLRRRLQDQGLSPARYRSMSRRPHRSPAELISI